MGKYIECKIVYLLLLTQLRSKRATILILNFLSLDIAQRTVAIP